MRSASALLERTKIRRPGLAAGRHYNWPPFGLLGAVAAVTPSPRDVVRLFVKYQHLTFTFFLLELDEAGERLLATVTGPLHRFYLDRDSRSSSVPRVACGRPAIAC